MKNLSCFGCITGSMKNFPLFKTRHNFLNTLFPSTTIEWKIAIKCNKLRLFHYFSKNYPEIFRQSVSLTVIIRKKLNLLQDCNSAPVTCSNTNPSIVFVIY